MSYKIKTRKLLFDLLFVLAITLVIIYLVGPVPLKDSWPILLGVAIIFAAKKAYDYAVRRWAPGTPTAHFGFKSKT